MSGEKPANLPRRVLILAGAGMGTAETMTQEAIKAVRECQGVFGAPRMVKLAEELRAANSPRYPSVAEYLPDPVFSWLRAHPDCESAVVLMSGDTGFYSGAAGFAGRLETEGWSLRILPGISSLSAMAAALGLLLAACLDASALTGPLRPLADALLVLGGGLALMVAMLLVRDETLRMYHLLALLTGAVLYSQGIGRLVRMARARIQKRKKTRKAEP